MLPTLPMCASPAAFKLLCQQTPSIESSDALLYGAVAVSMHQMENVDPSGVDALLQGYVDAIRSRVRGGQPQALLAHLHSFLFDEQGFTGEQDDYYNPLNSYLPHVLHSKRGLPITLSLIYKVVAERLGLRVWGVALPGHFVCGLASEGTTMLVDPFDGGRILSPAEAHEKMHETFGEDVEWSDMLLEPASNRHWLTRILQNLLNVFGQAGQYADVAAMLEMEMLLWPEEQRLHRDLALVLARCGMSEPARVWLDSYLKANPDDPQRSDLEQLLDVLMA